MRKTILFVGLILSMHIAYAQDRIRVPMNLMLMLKVPIQPNDTSWKKWNYIPNPKDSAQTLRIDRRVQGFPAFIPRNDAPFYNELQRNEIRLGFEKILNPDGYFATQEEFMTFCNGFLIKFVYTKSETQ